MDKKMLSWLGVIVTSTLITILIIFSQKFLKTDGYLDKSRHLDNKKNNLGSFKIHDRLDSISGIPGNKVFYKKTKDYNKQYLDNGDSIVTNLFEFEYIGKIMSKGKTFAVFSGRDCDACDANISIYIHNPKEGKFLVTNSRDSYSYPGELHYFINDSIVSKTRAFYGNVLKNKVGVIWNHYYLTEGGGWKESTYFIDVTSGQKKEVKFPNRDSLITTLNLLKQGSCKEIEGKIMTTEP